MKTYRDEERDGRNYAVGSYSSIEDVLQHDVYELDEEESLVEILPDRLEGEKHDGTEQTEGGDTRGFLLFSKNGDLVFYMVSDPQGPVNEYGEEETPP